MVLFFTVNAIEIAFFLLISGLDAMGRQPPSIMVNNLFLKALSVYF